MKIHTYSRGKIEQDIPCPSFFEFEWFNEHGHTKFYIKVDDIFKRTVMISDCQNGYACRIEKEEWNGYEDEHFKWRESSEEAFKEAIKFALNVL